MRVQGSNLHHSEEGSAPIRVVMLDLLCIVPYYTGHLCASFKPSDSLRVTLASISYSHDRRCFIRHGIRNASGLIDITFRLPWLPALLRRALKVCECLLNMVLLLVRFSSSKPDVVHVQFLPLLSFGLPIEMWFIGRLRAKGIRIIHTVHNVLPQNTGDRYRALYGRLYAFADRLICHDARAASRLVSEFSVPADRIWVIPHGPLFENSSDMPVRQVREKLGLPADGCVVLWQGILRPYKGVSFLLKAWRQACAGRPNTVLAIVGTGEKDILQQVRDEVRVLGLSERVRLELRFVSVEELNDFYEAADLLVYPYSEVTTSGALLTGVSKGKAIIATALPAFQEIIHQGKTGLLVPYGDIGALAGALALLIDNAEVRCRLAAELSVRQAQLPRWPDIAIQTAENYRAVLYGKPACRAEAVRQ